MNRITLLPNHSKSWCLSPGIFLFFDEVEMDKSDFLRINNPKSSFDAKALDNLKKLTSESNFKIVPSDLSPIDPFNKSSITLAENELSEILDYFPVEKNNGIITHDEIRTALKHAYKIFIDYNKWKFKLLSKDEKLYLELKENRFKEWSSYQQSLSKIKISDFYPWLKNQQELWNVAVNLISISRNILNSIRNDKSIYDPLYEEFRPWLNILIKKDAIAYTAKVDLSTIEFDNLLQFEFNKLAPSSSTELSLIELLKVRRKLISLRNLLGEQKIVWSDFLTSKATYAEKELKKISLNINNSSKSVPWLCYGLCSLVSFPLLSSIFESDYIPFVISSLLGVPLLPVVLAKQIKKYSATFYPMLPASKNQRIGFINIIEKVKLNNLNKEVPFKDGIINFWTK
jgi:hypothetical protein